MEKGSTEGFLVFERSACHCYLGCSLTVLERDYNFYFFLVGLWGLPRVDFKVSGANPGNFIRR